MDKFVITGGAAAQRRDPDQRLEELGAAGAGRGAADRRAGDAAPHPARARHPHHGAAAGGYRRARRSGGRDRSGCETERDRLPRGALRTGEDHARFEPGAGAAGGALRPRARLAAGRLRHRRAAHQPAHFRARTARRAGSTRRTATSRRRRPTGCAARRSTSTASPSPAPKT